MNDVEEAIYDALNVGALNGYVNGRIYRDAAPLGAAYPLVIFAYQGGGDDEETPVRARSPLYQVRAVSTLSADAAGDIAAVIDGLLHHATLNVSGYTNYYTAATTALSATEFDEALGVHFWHRGSNYRIRIAQ